MTDIEKAIAINAIAAQLKSGDTSGIFKHLGDSWSGSGSNSQMHRIAVEINKATSSLANVQEQIEDACAYLKEEGATPDELEALAKGLCSGAQSAVLAEIEKMVSEVFTHRLGNSF